MDYQYDRTGRRISQSTGQPLATVYDERDALAKDNARLREACQVLVSWADYDGDAVSMLDGAVGLARQALKLSECEHDYQDFGPNERIIGTATICVKCGAIHPKHLGNSPHET